MNKVIKINDLLGTKECIFQSRSPVFKFKFFFYLLNLLFYTKIFNTFNVVQTVIK